MLDDLIGSEVAKITGEEIEPREKHSLGKVKGFVSNPEKSPMRKFADTFFEEDLVSIRESLVRDVIIPTIKDFMADIAIGGAERLFYGRGRGRSSSGSSRTGGNSSLARTSYDQKYTKASAVVEKDIPEVRRFTFDDVIMTDYPAAEDLLNMLKKAIKDYGSVSVYELYDALYNDDTAAVDVDYSDNYIGWTNLDSAFIRRMGGRTYKVVLPKPVVLKGND